MEEIFHDNVLRLKIFMFSGLGEKRDLWAEQPVPIPGHPLQDSTGGLLSEVYWLRSALQVQVKRVFQRGRANQHRGYGGDLFRSSKG